MDLRTSGLDNLVVLGTLARDHQVARHVGEEYYGLVQFLVVCFCLGEEFGGPGLHGSDLPLDLLGLFPLALLHQASDLGGELLLAGEQRIALRLESPAVGIQFKYLCNYVLCIEILDCELLDHALRILAKHLYCQHICLMF